MILLRTVPLHSILFSFRYSDYRDTVLSLMADVSRMKFQGVIPGAPVGMTRNIDIFQQPKTMINKQCSDQLKNLAKNEEKVLVTPL